MNLVKMHQQDYIAHAHAVKGEFVLVKINGTAQIGVGTTKHVLFRRAIAGQHRSFNLLERRPELWGGKLALGTSVAIEHNAHECFVLALLGRSHGVGELGDER